MSALAHLPHGDLLSRELASNSTRWELLASEAEAEAWAETLCARVAGEDAGEGFEAAGVVWAAAVIAETGSLVLTGGPGSARRPSLTVYHQVVLARASTLFADLESYLKSLPASRLHELMGSHLTLISGPSRTADIEKILVMPAHGPAAVWLGLIDDLPAASAPGSRG